MAVTDRRHRVQRKAKARREKSPRQSRQSGLAKFTAPAAEWVYPRTRLFQQLDQALARHTVVWVTAPAGYGKTLLAASYLKTRKLGHLWYQIDAGDADPASFFHTMGHAAQQLAPSRHLLPALTPEYYAGLPTFTRNFARELYRRIRKPGLIVLDNFQELPAGSPLIDLLVHAFDEVPAGLRFLVLARVAPPEVFARLRANSALGEVNTAALSLTLEESRGIGELHTGQKLEARVLAQLHGTAQGWAAGLILMLQRPEAVVNRAALADDVALSTVFDYFATEVLRHAPENVQDFLLKTSLLPAVRPQVARALTGNPGAASLLADLSRRNYFITAHIKDGPVYQYHPLFQDFLRAEVHRRLGDDELKTLRATAAGLLRDTGDVESAMDLWLQAGATEPAIGLILVHAEGLIRQGRYEVLRNWLERLPATRRDADPWLLYWYASARLPRVNEAVLADYARAYALFRKEGQDVAGMYLSLTTLVDTYLAAWNEFATLEPWLDELEALRREHPKAPSPEIERYMTSAMLVAYMMCRPHDPRVHRWLAQAESMFKRLTEPGAKLKLARSLLVAHSWFGNIVRAEVVLNSVRGIFNHPGGNPIDRMFCCLYDAVQGWHVGDTRRWRESTEHGLKVVRENGIQVMTGNMIGQGVYGSLSDNDLVSSAGYLAHMRATVNFNRPMDGVHYHYLAMWDALQRHAYPEARVLGEQALDYAMTAAIPFPEGLVRNVLAHALFECGEPQAAREQLAQSRQLSDAIGTPILQIQTACTEAYFLLREGDEAQALIPLHRALARMRESGLTNYPGWRHDVMSFLCAVALEHDIAAQFVRQLIQHRHLVSPTDRVVSDSWPFPLKIHTLGRFTLLRDDKPMHFEGKTQKKPLELLKLLAAFGGREVAESRITDALWPNTEAGQARQNFKATLHRLRKLIGNEALVLNEGKLTLDAHRVWVDVWTFERLLNESREYLNSGRAKHAIDAGQRAAKLYQGPFLAADDQPFVLPLRERLRARLLGQLGELAQSLCQSKACDESLALYRKGLEIDPLTEFFYQGLMRCYQCLHQPAEALKTYERCRRLLKSQLGLDPSPQTEALARDIRRPAG
jgi:LuxR family transcriptional regulator, maltose regulon positive regulatory protein